MCPTNLSPVKPPGPSHQMSVLRQRLFLAMVAVLPLHTLFLSAWISWKPYLVILIVIVVLDLVDWVQTREYPWHRGISLALGGLLVVVLIGWPQSDYLERFVQLLLALAVGALVLLTTERSLRLPGMLARMLHVAVWSAGLIGVTAVFFEMVALGVFGATAHTTIGQLPGVFRVVKPAYLDEGFFALTNWHQDPGYSAAWSNLWIVLVVAASVRGAATGRRWLDGAIIGGLAFNVLMAFSRTGWIALPIVIAVAVLLLVRSGTATLRLRSQDL